MLSHRQLAEQLLGAPISPEGFAPCPGAHLHTTADGARDFQLFFDPNGKDLPHEHCFHASCQPARDQFMRALYSAIKRQERGERPHPKKQFLPPPTPQPSPRAFKPALDLGRAAALASQCPCDITDSWLAARSPIPIPPDPASWPALLLDSLYRPGERILIFDKFASQGQYIRVVGKSNYKLASCPGRPAVPHPALPSEGAEGVWFLCSPITGAWLPNPNNIDPKTKQPRPGRRHSACCTRYPYAVLESDTIAPAQWLRILAQLTDPVCAVYTSGGASIHALISTNSAATPEQFNVYRNNLRRRLAPVGADPAALSAVRLTRLPGPLRLNKADPESGCPARQKLLFINPFPQPGVRLLDLPRLR